MKIAMTGGHHSSALPLIEYIYRQDPNVEILWFGHKHSAKGDKNPTMEFLQITEKGIPFIDLPAGKFYKTYNIFRLAKIPLGFVFAFFHLVKNKPDVIFSFGGYLAVPVVIMGWVLGIPSVTHEQTVVAGYANKLISKFVKKVLISHEESFSYFPKEKTIFSGLPLRKAIFEVRSNSFEFKNNLPILYITCGKTGSHKINEAISRCLPELLQKYNIIHQCGDHSLYNDYDKLLVRYGTILDSITTEEKPPFFDITSKASLGEESVVSSNLGTYYLRKFVLDNEIGEIFSKADILLSRSGAHIVAEIETFQKPSVLVPIPWVSHNEQFLNAQVVEKTGLGVILPEDQLNCDNILNSLEEALNKNQPKNEIEKLQYSESSLKIMYQEIQSLYD